MHDAPLTLARAPGVHGEVAVRRRQDGDESVYELIVNGVFLMDTTETSTERMLADVLLDRHPAPRRVLVGGLGFGTTARTLLTDVRVEQIHVVEIEPVLVEWMRGGMIPGIDTVLADPRLRITVGNVLDEVGMAEPGSYDGILLDVDNGPGFLVHSDNAAVYERPALESARDALAGGGMLAVWSADPAPQLRDALSDVLGAYIELDKTVIRSGREVTYHLYLATK